LLLVSEAACTAAAAGPWSRKLGSRIAVGLGSRILLLVPEATLLLVSEAMLLSVSDAASLSVYEAALRIVPLVLVSEAALLSVSEAALLLVSETESNTASKNNSNAAPETNGNGNWVCAPISLPQRMGLLGIPLAPNKGTRYAPRAPPRYPLPDVRILISHLGSADKITKVSR
jgi:hypothetical protein